MRACPFSEALGALALRRPRAAGSPEAPPTVRRVCTAGGYGDCVAMTLLAGCRACLFTSARTHLPCRLVRLCGAGASFASCSRPSRLLLPEAGRYATPVLLASLASRGLFHFPVKDRAAERARMRRGDARACPRRRGVSCGCWPRVRCWPRARVPSGDARACLRLQHARLYASCPLTFPGLHKI